MGPNATEMTISNMRAQLEYRLEIQIQIATEDGDGSSLAQEAPQAIREVASLHCAIPQDYRDMHKLADIAFGRIVNSYL
jgi:hypothetical protein